MQALTYLLTALVPLAGGGNSLFHSKIGHGHFFSKEYTDVLKGLCCLIVIYVHVWPERGNTLQDAIGSFAYVAVTFFFLVSGYGMLAGIERKNNYLKHFWRNRLVSLLIPCILVNIVGYTLGVIVRGNTEPSVLFIINSYVVVLLQWCIWVYIIELCRVRWFSKNIILTDYLLIIGVLVSSLVLYLFMDGDGWCFERMGLVWGVLLYRYFVKIVAWMNKHRLMKAVFLIVIGGILGIAYLKYKPVFFWGAYLLKIVLAFVLLLLLFTATSNRKFGDKISDWLGSVSYEVYLSHGIALGTMSYVIPMDFNSGAYILISVIITLILSTGIHALGKPVVKKLRS